MTKPSPCFFSLATLLGTLAILSGAGTPFASAAQPSLDTVLGKLVTASGGAEAIRKVHSRHYKGKISSDLFGVATWELLAKAPNKRLSLTEVEGMGSMTDGCDGKVAWSRNPMTGLIVRSGEQAARALREADFYKELNMATLYPTLKITGSDRVGEEDAWVAEAKSAGGTMDRFYFGKKSGRLLKHFGEFEGDTGATQTVTVFGAFKQVDDLIVPHQIDLSITGPDGGEIDLVLELADVKHNLPIEDSRFDKPSS